MSGKIATAKEQFRQFITEKGLKSTSQREDIADIFFKTTTHVSLEEVLKKVRRKNSRVGYATVYRTMRLLAECGLAFERQFGDGQTRYEHLIDDSHHDHLICVKCGAIAEFSNQTIEELQKRIATEKGFTVINHKMELYGHCAKCQ